MADNLTPKEEFLLNPVTEHNITDAAVASFETNFKHPLKVTVPITPIQDLHGMPNPYPAGASVNLIPDGTNTENGYVAGQYLVTDGTTTANTNYYVSEYFQISENTVYTWSNRVNTSVTPAICFYDENKTFISGININGQYSQTFTSPAGAVYCRSSQTTYTHQEASSGNAAYQLEIGEIATAYRRYSNICPIEGSLGIEIYGTRHQLFDKTKLIHGRYFGANGILTANSVSGYCFVKVYGLQYITISGSTGWTAARCCFFDENKRYISGSEVKRNCVLTVPSNAYYFGASSLDQPSRADYDLDTYMIEPGQVAHEYEAITNAVPITFTNPSTGDPMTVYGGTLTLNEDGSADLSKTHVKIVIDGTKYAIGNISTTDTRTSFRVSASDIPSDEIWKNRGQSVLAGAISNWAIEAYQQYGHNNDYTSFKPNSFALSGNYRSYRQIGICIDPVENATVEYIREYLEQNPLEICYMLDTPKSYHFPNIGQLKAFLGQNNVWSDIANVDVKYLTQNSQTGIEYRGDRALELRRRAMIADAPKIHTTVGSSATGGLASFKSYVKAPVKKIEIPFSPKQNFNGYDFPWPGGGYVQLFNSATTTYGSKIDVDGTLTEDADYFVSDFIPVTASTYYYVSGEMPVVVGYNSSKELLQVIKNSGTGGAFQTPENCAYVRIQNYTEESDASAQANAAGTAYVCAGSEENQWYPYENICPIEGYDGCEITRTGKNLFDKSKVINGYYMGSAGIPAGSSAFGYALVHVGGLSTVRISGNRAENSAARYIPFDSNGHALITASAQGKGNKTITLPAGTKTLAVSVYISGTNKDIDTVQVEAGSVASAYENFGTTIPFTFNQSGDHAFLPIQEGTGDPSPENVRPIHPGLTFTRDDDSVLSVYGGTLTVNSDGTSDISNEWTSLMTFNGTENWKTSTGGRVYCDVPPKGFYSSSQATILCNKLKPVSSGVSTINTNCIFVFTTLENAIRLGARINNNTTVESFKEFLSENPITIIYKLSTPTTYALSVTETNRALEALGLTQHIGPLYGGTITINPDGSADVVVNRGMADLGDFTYTKNALSSTEHYYFTSNNNSLVNAVGSANYASSGAICEQYVDTGLLATTGNGFSIYTLNQRVNVRDFTKDNYTVAEFKTAMAGVKVVYLLVTPQTYHFSNLEQLKVWLGKNNFWCDISDDITVKYLNRG